MTKSAMPKAMQVTSLATSPKSFVESLGPAFAVFDGRTQDSGHVSYGVEVEGRRWFIKTAGEPVVAAGSSFGPQGRTSPGLSFAQRCERLGNAALLWRTCPRRPLVTLHHVIDAASWGPILIYEWVDGQVLYDVSQRRSLPSSAHRRFGALPLPKRLRALGEVLNLHLRLSSLGWVASDFYDGALMYDFKAHTIHVMDLDLYHQGPFENQVGRLWGSSRFMAPEEKTLGAVVDERTTVFVMGRLLKIFVLDVARGEQVAPEALVNLVGKACAPKPTDRHASMEALWDAWRAAVVDLEGDGEVDWATCAQGSTPR